MPCHINWLAANSCPIGPAVPQPLDEIHFGESNTGHSSGTVGHTRKWAGTGMFAGTSSFGRGFLLLPTALPGLCSGKPLPTSWSSNRITRD